MGQTIGKVCLGVDYLQLKEIAQGNSQGSQQLVVKYRRGKAEPHLPDTVCEDGSVRMICLSDTDKEIHSIVRPDDIGKEVFIFKGAMLSYSEVVRCSETRVIYLDLTTKESFEATVSYNHDDKGESRVIVKIPGNSKGANRVITCIPGMYGENWCLINHKTIGKD